MSYLPGDVIARRKGLVLHKGVVLQDGRVLHNMPERGEHVSTLSEFADGQRLEVLAQPLDARRAAVRRAQAVARAPRHYDLISHNCDHTVTRLTEGRPRSPQVVNWLLGAGTALAVFAIAKNPRLALLAGAAVAKGRREH